MYNEEKNEVMINRKTIFWTLFSGVAIGGSWLIYNKFFKYGKSNYQMLQENLGVTSNTEKVVVKFNGGLNQATFWNNDRVFFSPFGSTQVLAKGTYFNGGKKIVLDGGKTIESDSVWLNLLNAIK